MSTDNTAIHLLAGGAGGTAGAVVTCPLEVVKTRLQSSVRQFTNKSVYIRQIVKGQNTNVKSNYSYSTASSFVSKGKLSKILSNDAKAQTGPSSNTNVTLIRYMKYIIETEGIKGLFKGLGPNLVGVAPSRAVYFCAYAQSKAFFNTVFTPDTPLVHIGSAFLAGFTASTLTNPIWFIKTRLQLDHKRFGSLSTFECIKSVYKQHGISGFYKGITASYYGISETIIHFVIYEGIKARLRKRNELNDTQTSAVSFVEFMVAGAVSKTIATFFAYPHEVARTRMREEGTKYRHFWQTLRTVLAEEGFAGLYLGLSAQLVRQIPNTAIMMATYEAVVYICSRQVINNDRDTDTE